MSDRENAVEFVRHVLVDAVSNILIRKLFSYYQ